MHKYERHNINLIKTEKKSLSIFCHIRIYIQYIHFQVEIDRNAPVKKQTIKIYAKLENDECVIKYMAYDKHENERKGDYLDAYEGIQSELNYVVKFDETTKIAFTYMSKKTTNKNRKV